MGGKHADAAVCRGRFLPVASDIPRFYLAINVGSLFAGTVIVFIQDQVSWTIGFAIPGECLSGEQGNL
jgi:hypothetical protein